MYYMTNRYQNGYCTVLSWRLVSLLGELMHSKQSSTDFYRIHWRQFYDLPWHYQSETKFRLPICQLLNSKKNWTQGFDVRSV